MEKSEILNSSYKEHPYRHLIGTLYGLALLLIGMLIMPYNTIYKQLEAGFAVSRSEIFSTQIFFYLGQFGIIFFVGNVITKHGVKKSLFLGMALVLIGAILRLGIIVAFLFVQVGQFMMGAGSSFVLSVQMQLCFNWFRPSKRGLLFTAFNILPFLGISLSLLLQNLLVPGDTNNADTLRNDIFWYNQLIALISALLFVFILYFMKEQPEKDFGWSKETY